MHHHATRLVSVRDPADDGRARVRQVRAAHHRHPERATLREQSRLPAARRTRARCVHCQAVAAARCSVLVHLDFFFRIHQGYPVRNVPPYYDQSAHFPALRRQTHVPHSQVGVTTLHESVLAISSIVRRVMYS